MFRHCGPGWRASYGRPGYGWPDQFGRGWYRRRGPFGSLISTAVLFGLIALAMSWWNGRRRTFDW